MTSVRVCWLRPFVLILLNQCSAAQQSEPVLLTVLMSSPINDPAYIPDNIEYLAINYSWDIFFLISAKLNSFHRVDKICQKVQKSDFQSQVAMSKNIGVFFF